MKFSIAIFVLLTFFTICTAAQCADEPKLHETGKVLRKLKLVQTGHAEIGLSIKAKVNAAWQTKGAEAAVLTVFVNGKYNQDVILFAGPRLFDYRILLGRLETGDHEISLVLNRERTAPGARNVRIASSKILPATYDGPAKMSALEKLAVAKAPFIYARPNAVDKFSDIPLITYYEILFETERDFKIRYTAIFSNEDGGTQTTALMARWGRTTDIEWVYELSFKEGELVSETYQGEGHETKKFAGHRAFGRHPKIYTVTENNNFADAGCSALRIAGFPVRADLSARSRETVMDENPWSYRVMAGEAMREGRIDPNNMGVNTIDDLRNYLYVEVHAENNSSAIAVEVKTADGKTGRSDLGDERLRVVRSGFQRMAVRLPSTVSPLNSLHLYCHALTGSPASGTCKNSRILAYIKLDKDFRSTKIQTKMSEALSLKPGENIMWLSPTNH